MPSRFLDLGFALLGVTVVAAVIVSLFDGPGAWGAGEALDMASPAFFPTLGAVGLATAAVAVGLRGLGRLAGERVEPPGLRPLVVFAWAAVMPWLIATVGFSIAAGATVVALAPVFGCRDPRLVVPTAIGLPLLVHLLFERVLLVRFPDGMLF